MTSPPGGPQLEDERDAIRSAPKRVEPCSAVEFWAVMDALAIECGEEGRGFFCNRGKILEDYCAKRMYVVHCSQDFDPSVKMELYDKGLFLPETDDTLSAFCSFDKAGGLQFIWTHKKLRGCGCGTAMVKYFALTSVGDVLPEAVGFWNKMSVVIGKVLQRRVISSPADMAKKIQQKDRGKAERTVATPLDDDKLSEAQTALPQ